MKLTRHNGRAGKNGTYNPRHNDRRFDVENSEHIDAERAKRNVYWDCYRNYTFAESRDDETRSDFSFEEIERMYYYEHYSDHVEAQNARNEKTRHTERNRTVEDLLRNNKTCPEESIYQIGTIEDSVTPGMLAQIAAEFFEEFERRFGSHVHILDWALHLDEGTPHIHERHVFDCENRYGEVCPQQEKALEELGIPLPDPDKPKGRNNNRKQTFDAVCRAMLFDISRQHGLHLDQEPSYGGRKYLEKQDYILMKQKEQMAGQQEVIETQEGIIEKQDETIRSQVGEISEQDEKLEELTLKVADVETLLDEVAEAAYDKAVEVVTDVVQAETRKEDIAILDEYQGRINRSKNSPQALKIANQVLDRAKEKLTAAAAGIAKKVAAFLHRPEVREAGTEQIKTQARSSILAKLAQAQERTDRENQERRDTDKSQRRKHDLEI